MSEPPAKRDPFVVLLAVVPELKERLLAGDDDAWHEVARELRRMHPRAFNGIAEPPPTKVAAGTQAKLDLIENRLRAGVALTSRRDAPPDPLCVAREVTLAGNQTPQRAGLRIQGGQPP